MACGIVWGTVWCCGWILPIGGEIGTPGAWRGICAGGGEGFTGCIACFASKSISVVSITSPFKISGKELAANSENLLSIFLSDVKPKKRILLLKPEKDNSTISGSKKMYPRLANPAISSE